MADAEMPGLYNIKSDERREQFHKRLIERLEEESILAGLTGSGGDVLELEIVDKEVIKLVMNNDGLKNHLKRIADKRISENVLGK